MMQKKYRRKWQKCLTLLLAAGLLSAAAAVLSPGMAASEVGHHALPPAALPVRRIILSHKLSFGIEHSKSWLCHNPIYAAIRTTVPHLYSQL